MAETSLSGLGARSLPVRWTAGAAASVALLLFVGLGVYGLWLGYAPDGDSVRLFDSARVILEGGYERSRSAGYPAFEFPLAVILALGGSVWHGALYALCLWLAALLVLVGLVPAAKRAGAIVAFCLTPVILTNASWPMETAQEALVFLVYFWIALSPGLRGRFAWLTLAGIVLVLTRLDACFAVTAVGLAAYAAERNRLHLVHVGLVGAVTFAVYTGLNGGLAFLGPYETTQEPLLRHVAKAAVMVYVAGAFFGLWAAVAVVRSWACVPRLERYLLVALLAAFLLRIVILPEEPEYLVIPYLALLVVAFRNAASANAGVLLAIGLVSNLFTPVLFERQDPRVDAHELTFRLARPGVLQDIDRRRAYQVFLSPAAYELIRRKSGIDVAPTVFHDWLPDASGRDLVVFTDAIFAFTGARSREMAFADLSQYRRIVLCEGSRVPSRGWRSLRPLEPSTVAEAVEGRAELQCREGADELRRLQAEGAKGAAVQ